MGKEHAIQNDGRNALAGKCLNFRAQVGQAWTGNVKRLPGNRVLIENARPFNTGLPPGFSDTFGLTPELVTPEWCKAMMGKLVGIFHAIEYKSDGGRLTQKQKDFIAAIIRNGGRAGVARSAQDAIDIALGNIA